MARKKKKITTKDKITSSVSVEGTQNIDYSGKVAIKVVRGNKVITSRTYHNSGCPSLFKFLCNCLAGEFTHSLRPSKIKLFNYDWHEHEVAEGYTTLGALKWEEAFDPAKLNGNSAEYKSYPTSASTFVSYDATPVIKKQAETNAYEITYHFRVPFSLISNDVIHMIGLFPNGIVNGYEKDACAYYLFTELNSETKQLQWAPLNLGDVSGNYSLIIDWTMSIANKTTNN